MRQKRICYIPDKLTCGTCSKQGRDLCIGRRNEERGCPAHEYKTLCYKCKHSFKEEHHVTPSCKIKTGERTIYLSGIFRCPCCDYYEER